MSYLRNVCIHIRVYMGMSLGLTYASFKDGAQNIKTNLTASNVSQSDADK
jgi:hypothetical protein